VGERAKYCCLCGKNTSYCPIQKYCCWVAHVWWPQPDQPSGLFWDVWVQNFGRHLGRPGRVLGLWSQYFFESNCYTRASILTFHYLNLKFDDGPLPPSPALYDFLQTNNQHATHFFIGTNILSYPSTFLQAFQNGDDMAFVFPPLIISPLSDNSVQCTHLDTSGSCYMSVLLYLLTFYQLTVHDYSVQP